MLLDWLPWLLQITDSQFPSGAYAHSLGLEELTQRGLVRMPQDVERFLHEQILPSLRAFELPFLARAHAEAAAGRVEGLRQLDEELDAWKLAQELRLASRKLGSRRLVMLRKLAPAALLEEYAALEAPCHHMIVYSLELRNVPVEAVACGFALQTVSGYAVAAMKLVRMGQERCQMMVRGAMTALSPDIAASLEPGTGNRELGTGNWEPGTGWFNPLLEIASLRHARAHERLFIS